MKKINSHAYIIIYYILNILDRGYEFSRLLASVLTIGKIDREALLPYKNNYNNNSNIIKSAKSFYFGSEFNKCFSNLNELVSDLFNSIIKDSVLKNYKLQLCNSMSSYMFSIFVHKNYTSRSFFKNTTCWDSINCMISKFINLNWFYYFRLRDSRDFTSFPVKLPSKITELNDT
jgi:hypothetical protein